MDEKNIDCEKMKDYVTSLFSVFKMVYNKSENQKDNRLQMIALTIYNYTRYIATENNVDLSSLTNSITINLVPIFDYIDCKKIELYDFSKINILDVDVKKKEDLEKFVLTHIYYITQSK
jgi:hypothetical protein